MRIDVLVAGEFPGDGKPKPVAFPDPQTSAVEVEGIRFLSLPRLIELKLASGMTAPDRLRDLADVQELIRAEQLDDGFADQLDASVRARFRELLVATTVTIHGNAWKRADVEDAVADCRGHQWRHERWFRRDALVQRTGTTSLYVGQRYDPAHCELVRNGWSHDHCEICWWTLSEGGDEEHSVGYTDGRRWICSECYHQFIASEHCAQSTTPPLR